MKSAVQLGLFWEMKSVTVSAFHTCATWTILENNTAVLQAQAVSYILYTHNQIQAASNKTWLYKRELTSENKVLEQDFDGESNIESK